MAAKMNTIYKLCEIKDSFFKIEGNSILETVDKDAYIKIDEMPLKYDLKGTMFSEIKIDNQTGWIIEAKINQEIQGIAQVKKNWKMPDGMKIPMNIKTEIQITN